MPPREEKRETRYSRVGHRGPNRGVQLFPVFKKKKIRKTLVVGRSGAGQVRAQAGVTGMGIAAVV